MKNLKSLLLLCLSFVFILSSCISTDSGGEEEYYSAEEVLDSWKEALFDADLEQFGSVYWPDAFMLVKRSDEEDPREMSGREEIIEYQRDIFSRVEIDEDEFPRIELEELPEGGRIEAWLIHERYDLREILVLARRGELWGIAEHHIHPLHRWEVRSPLHEWADEDKDGVLNGSEFEQVAHASHQMLRTPHKVEESFSEAFDLDKSGFIDQAEIERFRAYYLTELLPRLPYEERDAALRYLDLDRNREISDRELDEVREYLQKAIPRNNPELASEDPMRNFLDKNGDGTIDTDEFNNFFFGLTETLAMYPHPPRPLGQDSAPVELTRGSLDGKRLAVVGIDTVTDSISEETVRGLVLFVENGFVNTGRVKVVDRKNIEGIIEEYNFQRGGLTDEDTAVEIGKLAGAEIIVTGTVSSVGSNYYLQLRLIDVATAEVVASSLGEAKIENEFLPMSTMAVERLF